jgi:hypothetical protein
LRQELVTWVRKEIGPIASPDMIQFSSGLPKTRSGKIMRRILRKIAGDDFSNLSDTTTLADRPDRPDRGRRSRDESAEPQERRIASRRESLPPCKSGEKDRPSPQESRERAPAAGANGRNAAVTVAALPHLSFTSVTERRSPCRGATIYQF